MKTRYTKSQIVDAINFWHNELLRESLEPKTEAKLKDAAKVFAKAIGNMITAGGMFRFEDGETRSACCNQDNNQEGCLG